LELLLVAGALILWTLFLSTRVGDWPAEIVVGLVWLPASFLPLWAIWTSVQVYRQEWRENTSYLVLSLPARAWTITSAKLAVVAAGLIGYSALTAAGALLLGARTGIARSPALADLFSVWPADWFVKTALLAWAGWLFVLLLLCVVTQAAYVFSRLFHRFQLLVMVWAWVLFSWVLATAGSIGGWLFAWLPDFHIRALHVANDLPGFQTVTVQSGPVVGVFLAGLGLYWLINLVMEQAVEV